MIQSRITKLLLMLMLCAGSGLVAADDHGDRASKLELDLVGLYNPLGISLAARSYFRNTYHHDDAPLWDGLYWQAGGQLATNPAYQRAGLHLEWMPIAVMQLRAQYDRYYFTGSNGTLLAFDSSDQAYGDNEIKARQGQEQSGYGNRYLANLTLRARLGNIILRNVSDVAKYEFPGAGPYYLEREYELLMASNDYIFSNQTYLLFEHNNGQGRTTWFGPYYDYVRVRETGLVRERLGLTVYQEHAKAIGMLQKPRWYLQSGVYLTERNRQDEFYLVLGIGGDLEF